MTHTYFWTAILLAGLLANLRTLTEAMRRRRLVIESGRERALMIIAAQAVRGEAVTLAVQLLLAVLIGSAWALPAAATSVGATVGFPLEAQRVILLCGWTLAACSVALTVDSLLDMRDRRRLVRELIRQHVGAGGDRSGPERQR